MRHYALNIVLSLLQFLDLLQFLWFHVYFLFSFVAVLHEDVPFVVSFGCANVAKVQPDTRTKTTPCGGTSAVNRPVNRPSS
eukprot:SAG31_NODE_19233_length_608_cov_2.715128_1_plen_80_part_10